jgi:hypothetical protein
MNFHFDFDWYSIYFKDNLVKDGYIYYIGQKMHPFLPKMTIEGCSNMYCKMSSITKIYYPKDNINRQLGEFNHIGSSEEAFYSALLNGLYALLNDNVKRVLVESSNKGMVCDVIDILLYSKHKREQYWYKKELMRILNKFRLFAIKWTDYKEDEEMDGDKKSLDSSIAYIYT